MSDGVSLDFKIIWALGFPTDHSPVCLIFSQDKFEYLHRLAGLCSPPLRVIFFERKERFADDAPLTQRILAFLEANTNSEGSWVNFPTSQIASVSAGAFELALY